MGTNQKCLVVCSSVHPFIQKCVLLYIANFQKNMKQLPTLFRLCLLTSFTCLSLAFGVKFSGQGPAPLFVDDEVLDLRLAFNMDSILLDRGEDPHYHAARLSVRNGESKTNFDLKIKPRGNFRLSPMNCNFPPIKLNFSKKETGETLFKGQNKLKLVTHCSDQKYVLNEYLAYKIYQLINPESFQVRLARITYADFVRKHKPITRFAFMLEDEDALAARLGGDLIDEDSIRFTEAESVTKITARLYLFQYLLGNRDWDIPMKKNIKIVRRKGEKAIPVPYDFDFTGWVDANYTKAYMGDLAEKFEYRIGREFCLPNAVWEAQIQYFTSKKAEIIQLISEFELLNKRERSRLISYVESFYEDINNPQKVQELFGDCP